MKRISIKNIADIVGVSTATVSLVLSDKAKNGRVSEKMSNKIISVAKELNYRPNMLAKSLQSGMSKTIGLLVADIANPFFSLLAYHIQKEMQQHDYAVIIVNTDEDNTQMSNMISLLRNRQVDGFIIIPTDGGESAIKELYDTKTPLVLVDRSFPNINTCNVLVDNYDAVYNATCYLLEKGCEKIAFVVYTSSLHHLSERERGYRTAMEKYGKFDEQSIHRVDYLNLDEDIKQVVQDMKQKQGAYDGVLFAANRISLTTIKEMLRDGVKIGEDIDIVCFDKSECFDFLPVSLPYIHQPIIDLGCKAVELLIDQIKNGHSEADENTYILPSEFKHS